MNWNGLEYYQFFLSRDKAYFFSGTRSYKKISPTDKCTHAYGGLGNLTEFCT